ncbi:MAG: FAD-binding protein, partial [Coriobacteriales bacterium]|nr:FAD-binding protein [Coriobacteriales bacterium]
METITRRTFVAGTAGIAATAALAGTVLADAAAPADGTYTTSAEGRNGLVTVETTFADGVITNVEVVSQQETQVFTEDAIPQLCENIVAANSFGIDGISGATWTSAAILTAVRQAVIEAGGDAAAFNIPTTYEPGEDEVIDVDVAVVGAGGSGILTAARAAEAGAKVALLEKVRLVGGCSLMSFMMATYAPEVIKDKMVSWIEGQMYLADPTVIHAYLEGTVPTAEYLASATTEANMFPSYNDPKAFFKTMLTGYMDRPVVYKELLANTVEANGGGVYTNHKVVELLTNADGSMAGVVAVRPDGSTLTVNAKAVVIATGGFGGDNARIKAATGYDVECGCLTQCMGEGIDLAWGIGAAKPATFGGLQLHQTLAAAKLRGYEYFQQQMPMILGYVPSVLDVTPAGVRFRNEDWVNVATAAAGSGAFAGGTTYAMLDQDMVDALINEGTQGIGFMSSPGMPPEYKPQFSIDTPWEGFQQVLDDCVANDWAYTGDSLEALAEAANMDPAVLIETVEKYNAYCDAGQDDFFGKDPTHLIPIKTPPFYFVKIRYNQLGTIGGLIINDK